MNAFSLCQENIPQTWSYFYRFHQQKPNETKLKCVQALSTRRQRKKVTDRKTEKEIEKECQDKWPRSRHASNEKWSWKRAMMMMMMMDAACSHHCGVDGCLREYGHSSRHWCPKCLWCRYLLWWCRLARRPDPCSPHRRGSKGEWRLWAEGCKVKSGVLKIKQKLTVNFSISDIGTIKWVHFEQ